MNIKHIAAREIYDSRGWPTVQCEIFLENGQSVVASVPSGISVGVYEAIEFRDGGNRLFGRGVLRAIENIEQIIAPQLIGKSPNGLEMDLKLIDIDGTEEKSRLGSNAMLAVSMAVYKAEALIENLQLFELVAHVMGFETVSLPVPYFNMINGGKHANNGLFIQEFMVLPLGITSFRGCMEAGALFYYELKEILKKNGKLRGEPLIAMGDEGGFASNFFDDFEALDILSQTASKMGSNFVFALDIASSQYYDSENKVYNFNNKSLTTDQMINFYEDLIKKYPIFSIEDGLSEHDWSGWIKMFKLMQNKTQIVGDDIFATNIYRIAKGAEEHLANSVIIKPNQVGTVTETLQAIKLCKSLNLNTIMSHRSGETEDTFIADMAVGSNCGQIKAGGLSRSERLAKYNRLLCIEDALTFGFFD